MSENNKNPSDDTDDPPRTAPPDFEQRVRECPSCCETGPCETHAHGPGEDTDGRFQKSKRRVLLMRAQQRREERVHERVSSMLTEQVERVLDAWDTEREAAGARGEPTDGIFPMPLLSLFSTFANVRSSASHAAVAKSEAGDGLGSMVAGGLMATLLGGALSKEEK